MNIYYILFCIMHISGAWAGMQEENMLRAAALYKEEKYSEALDIYNALDATMIGICENKGNCLWHSQHIPQAVYCWRKAQKTAMPAQYWMLQERIDAAHAQLGTAVHTSIATKIGTWFFVTMRYIPLWMWNICIISILLLVCWCVYQRKYRWLLYSCTVVLIMILLLFWCMYAAEQTVHGIVMNPATVHTGIDEHLPVIATLKQGHEVIIAKQLENWYQVSTGALQGWIAKQHVEII